MQLKKDGGRLVVDLLRVDGDWVSVTMRSRGGKRYRLSYSTKEHRFARSQELVKAHEYRHSDELLARVVRRALVQRIMGRFKGRDATVMPKT